MPSSTKVSFRVTGLEEYLEKIQKIGGNMETLVGEAIEASAQPIANDIRKWAEKHKRTGAALEGVDISPIQRDGDQIFVEVGINTKKKKSAWHIVFVEYGTPRMAADPGIRPAFKKNKVKVKNIQQEILQKGGVPID
jgi:HK97 gp10 family phage protein